MQFDPDLTLREQIELLASSLKVAQLALDRNPEVAERELRRCRGQLDELRGQAARTAHRGTDLLLAELAQVEAHIRRAEALLEERLVPA